jgi:hypothetical protein
MLLFYTKHGHLVATQTPFDKNHQTQSQSKYGENQYQAFLKFIGICSMN